MKLPTPSPRITVVTALAAVAIITGAAATQNQKERILYGPSSAVGNGDARMFVQLTRAGEPEVLGIALSESALTGLAPKMNLSSRCFDKDQDGKISHGECVGDQQSDLVLPPEAAKLRLPFRWATVNWNPEGHMAPAPPVWGAAHFDFHFFITDRSVIEAIRPGPCGELINCDDFKVASRALPDSHQPTDYIDVGAAVPSMGNHLIDKADPEIADPSRGFTRTFIYGSYDGRVIFLEPMVSRAFLQSRPDACSPVKAPRAWATPGYYPSRYCVRHDAATSTYRVTLEGLVYR